MYANPDGVSDRMWLGLQSFHGVGREVYSSIKFRHPRQQLSPSPPRAYLALSVPFLGSSF